MDEMHRMIIDGTIVSYTDESSVLEICNRNYIPIPQMCSMERLTPSGYCGLCTIELFDEAVLDQWIPMLACVLSPQKDMKIRTQSEKITAIREMAGQLMLRSHPCDCDTCEQFGHCELRRIYNKTGFGFTRAIEDGKRKKPILSRLSGRLLVDREKCTHCGLCVTFCREILGEDFLHLSLNNHDQRCLEVYPGMEYQEGYLLNLIEICPFHALFDERSFNVSPSWKLQAFDGISTESSTGNNIRIFVQDNEVAHIKPRKYPSIDHLIPDIARDLHRLNDTHRQDHPMLHGQKVDERTLMLSILKKIGFGHRCAMICNGSLSLENMMLIRQLANVLGARIFVRNKYQEGDGILISKDANANIRGALLTKVVESGAVDDFVEIEQKILGNQIHTLMIFGEDILSMEFSKEHFKKIHSITFSCHQNETTRNSHVVLPIYTMFEEDGHLINRDFMLQRFHRAIGRKTEAKSLWEWLAMIKNIYTGKGGDEAEFRSIEAIWKLLEKTIPEFANISFENLSPEGIKIENHRFQNYIFIA